MDAGANVKDEREAEIAAGRRAGDGSVRLSVFTRELLALSVEAHGQRASTLLLTRTQIDELQDALVRLGSQVSGARADDPAQANSDDNRENAPSPWDGRERRGGAR